MEPDRQLVGRERVARLPAVRLPLVESPGQSARLFRQRQHRGFDGMDRAVWFFEDRADAEAYRDQTGRPDFCVLFDLDEDEVLGKPGRPPAVTTPHP